MRLIVHPRDASRAKFISLLLAFIQVFVNAGPRDQLEAFCKSCRQREKQTKQLSVSGIFWGKVEGVYSQEEFAEKMGQILEEGEMYVEWETNFSVKFYSFHLLTRGC